MSKQLKKLWVEKYRPQNISEYIFKDTAFKHFVNDCIKTQSIPHLLLTGVQGTGKTTIARMLIAETNVHEADVLYINASEETSIDVVRSKITNFVTTFPLGDFKVVFLEEAANFSPDGQSALLSIMETYSDNVRFVFTCNYENKLLPALKSRTQHYRFSAMDKDDIAEYLANILIQEEINFDLDLLDDYINVGYPDIRKIVNLIEQYSKSGTLTPPIEESEQDYKFEALTLLKKGDWYNIRELLCSSVSPQEWEDVYKFFYTNLHECGPFKKGSEKWNLGIVTIADHLYKHSLVADPEINAAAMFINLGDITNG